MFSGRWIIFRFVIYYALICLYKPLLAMENLCKIG